jgi:very-short-patch-repair endonuclease
MNLLREITLRGGLAATHELLRAGATSHQLTRAVRAGAIVRIRQGWYGLPGAPLIPEAAVRIGGRATCVTAAAVHDLWTLPAPDIHVRIDDRHARARRPYNYRARLRGGDPVHIHWRRGGRGTRHVVAVEVALADMIGCQSAESVVAAVDCALGRGSLTRAAWRRILNRAPAIHRAELARVDGRSGSLLESIARFRLQALGVPLSIQVEIPGVGRVDFLIGDRTVVELDGWEHHQSREAFERDRLRDAELVRRGYKVLRFSYRRVMDDWPAVLATIREVAGV